MRNIDFKVLENISYKDYFVLKLYYDKQLDIRPGQFVNVNVESKFLRRPISVYDYSDKILTLTIRINGEGTYLLSKLKKDDNVNILLPLGNGVDLNEYDNEILLIGGGIGVAPLMYLLKKAKLNDLKVTCVLGYRDREHEILLEQFKDNCDNVYVSYDSDKENVIDVIKRERLYDKKFFCCGPMVMMKEVSKICKDGYFSLESRMGCGIGTCMGCCAGFKDGRKRICKDGPIFKKEEIIWENLM